MAKKKRRRPSRQRASRKRMSILIVQCVIWVIRLICALLEIGSLLRMTPDPCTRRMRCQPHAVLGCSGALFSLHR